MMIRKLLDRPDFRKAKMARVIVRNLTDGEEILGPTKKFNRGGLRGRDAQEAPKNAGNSHFEPARAASFLPKRVGMRHHAFRIFDYRCYYF
jgi:hypothetical protein